MELQWKVGYSEAAEQKPQEMYEAIVPGAVQLDYARAKGWPPFYEGLNFKAYEWMEDVYWHYKADLDFALEKDQYAELHFKGIDYKYRILIGEEILCEGEGMFSSVVCDVTKYAGKIHTLEVLIYPSPKCDDSCSRSQARYSCKAAACYGWDWHPRLVTAGLWDDVELVIKKEGSIQSVDFWYYLDEDLSTCELHTKVAVHGVGNIRMQLLDEEEIIVEKQCRAEEDVAEFCDSIANPKLWYPVGYGSQHRYTLCVMAETEEGIPFDQYTKKIGFRRSKMVMNVGSWRFPDKFPKSRSDAPATLEINGIRLFAKGSNWVNAQVFPGTMNREHYMNLLNLVQKANMNILRIWGGGFINKESFFDLCDEKGIMVWQEFPLACNEYPDDESYLAVLKKEATAIVKRLRNHPCVVLWCGGNELFNNWSRMTDQHHALRLLDKICYEEDRDTPFIMTSPLNGMGHGHYLNYDGEETITTLVQSSHTAYTEFGSPAAASADYIKKFISEEDFRNCSADNEVWVQHHAFNAWIKDSWLRKTEIDYYFGGASDVEDMIVKTQKIQEMCYNAYFEEMRKQWPHCSMALNWCFNEPWPTFANNSLISWPDIPRGSYYAVQKALRPQMTSLRVKKHLWKSGEIFQGEFWILNDTLSEMKPGTVEVWYAFGDSELQKWGEVRYDKVEKQTNVLCGTVQFIIPCEHEGAIHIYLWVKESPELDSEYIVLCRRNQASVHGRLNE